MREQVGDSPGKMSVRAAEGEARIRSLVFPAIVISSVAAVLLVFDWPICPTKNFLGIPCPGCGMTRALRAFLLGRWSAALVLHPLVFPFVALVTMEAFRALFGQNPGRSVRLWGVWMWGAFTVALVATWAVRLWFGVHPDPVELNYGVLGQWIP